MLTLAYWNLDGQADVDGDPITFGGCVLCGNPIMRGEEVKLGEAEGCMGLVHAQCCYAAEDAE